MYDPNFPDTSVNTDFTDNSDNSESPEYPDFDSFLDDIYEIKDIDEIMNSTKPTGTIDEYQYFINQSKVSNDFEHVLNEFLERAETFDNLVKIKRKQNEIEIEYMKYYPSIKNVKKLKIK